MKHFLIVPDMTQHTQTTKIEVRVYGITGNIPGFITKMTVDTVMRSVHLETVRVLAMLGYVKKEYAEHTYYRNDNPHFRIHLLGSEEV